MGKGFDQDKIAGCFGNPHTILSPGVSIKPYPCGVLTHPSMDAILAIVVENNLKPEDIGSVVLYAGSNILNPIYYEIARNELDAKFCMPFLLSTIVISRKAGIREFTQDFVNSQPVQRLMKRIRTEFDTEIEAKGWDKIRSRIEVTLKNGQKLVKDADERYRGGPDYPLAESALQNKFIDCTEGILAKEIQNKIFETIAALEKIDNIEKLINLAQTTL